MRKYFNLGKLRKLAVWGMGLLILAGLGGWLFVQTGLLDKWIRREISTALSEYNIRVEIGTVRPSLRQMGLGLDNVKFFAGTDKDPFASFNHLDARIRIRDLFRIGSPTEIALQDLNLDGLRFWYRLDAKGISNLSKIAFQRKKEEKDKVTFDYSSSRIALTDAQFFYVDTLRKLDGNARDFHLKAVWTGKEGFDIDARAADCSFLFEGRESRDLGIQLNAIAGDTGAKVRKLEITSPLMAASLNGELTDYTKLAYKLNARADLKMAEVTRVFLPANRLTGTTRFEGEVTGEGIEYQAKGRISSNDIQARDIRINGLNLRFGGTGKGADFSGEEELAFERLDTAGFRVNRVVAAGRMIGGKNAITWLPTFRAAEIRGNSFIASGIKLSDVKVNFPYDAPDRFKASARAGIENLVVADVKVGSLNGELTATRTEVSIPSWNGNIFGGTANGTARIALLSRGKSEVTANLTDLNLDQVAAVASGNRLPISGLTKGTVSASWTGNDYKSVEGAANLQFTGATTAADTGGKAGLPINGELNATASNKIIRLDRTIVQSGGTRITASGQIGWDRTGELSIGLNSENAMEFQSLALDLARPFAPEMVQQFNDQEIQLSRRINFDGRVIGSLDDPGVDGDFSFGAVNWHDELLGSISGKLAYARKEVKVSRGLLKQAEGGSAEFSVAIPLEQENAIAVTTSLKDFGIAAALRAVASLPLQVDGKLNGKADISGLPENAKGTANFAVTNGKYGPKEIEGLSGDLRLDGTRIEISNLGLKTGDGMLTGKLGFDTKTQGYHASLAGRNIDLNEWVNVAREEGKAPIPITGKIDLLVEAEAAESTIRQSTGRIFDKLDASVSGKEILYKNEPIRNLALSISGKDSVATLGLKAEALSQTHTGSGTVDFSKTDAPISLLLNFNETDVGKLLSIASGNELEAGGKTSGQVRLAGTLFGSADKLRLETEFSKLYFDVTDYRLTASTPFTVRMNADQLDLGTVRLSGNNTNVTVAGSVALSDAGRNSLNINGDVNLKVIQTLTREAFADGTLKIEASATGSYKQPKFSGQASLQDGALRLPGFPLGLNKARGRLLFTADQAQLAQFEAEVGTGKIRASGGASFVGFKPNRWRFQIKPEGVRVDYPRDARATVDGDLELQGSRDIQLLTGIVNVRRTEYLADVDLFEFIQRQTEQFGNPSIGAAGGDDNALPPTQIDIRVVANETLSLRTKLLDVTGSLNLRLKGPIEDPAVAGRITISRGTVDNVFGQRFRIANAGTIEFPGVDKRAGQMNIEAESDIKGYRVIANFSGSLEQPRMRMRAEPSLPEPEVYNLIATGRLQNEDRLTSSSTSQALVQTSLNTAASFIAQRASRSVESNVTGRLFGLNRFSVDPLLAGNGTDPTARITVGRRLTKDLSITYSTNLATNQDQVILIEYQASDKLSFVASRAQDGTFGLDVRLRKRF